MNKYMEINGLKVWDFDDVECNTEANKVIANGMILLFAQWMQDHCDKIASPIAWDGLGTIVCDLLSNTSTIRNGNRLDFFNNYAFTEDGFLEFSDLFYHKNGLVYARVYDNVNDRYVGYVEINS